jgi:hypothetical protein
MKTFLWIIVAPFVLLLLLVLTLWRFNLGVFAEDATAKAERFLGASAVCGESHNATLRCVRDSVVLTCVVHDERVACGQGDFPMPEGWWKQ